MAKAVGVSVYQYNKDNTFVKSYESISEAARAMNCFKGGIQRALNKSNFTSKGYIWKTTSPNQTCEWRRPSLRGEPDSPTSKAGWSGQCCHLALSGPALRLLHIHSIPFPLAA